MVLSSSEDVYIGSIICSIYIFKKCKNYQNDKEYLLFLSEHITKLVDIAPRQHLSVALAMLSYLSYIAKICLFLSLQHLKPRSVRIMTLIAFSIMFMF